jgi:hypothetical protein
MQFLNVQTFAQTPTNSVSSSGSVSASNSQVCVVLATSDQVAQAAAAQSAGKHGI